MLKKITCLIFLLLLNLNVYGEEKTPFFDITNLTETFLKSEINKFYSKQSGDKTQIFNDAINKFNQGNASAAYDDYSKIIDMTKTDFGLLNLAKTLYKIGFFSLAENALNKTEQKEEMKNLLNDLKKSGSAKPLTYDEEIYLGKTLSSILYDNMASEMIFDLNKHEDILEKSDWANYVMANAYIQMKQYKQALSFINKAIAKNQYNNLYILLKLQILIFQGNYKIALNYAEKAEKANLIKIPFLNDFTIQKKIVLQNLAKEKEEKLLYKAEIEILKDDVYSAIKTLDEIISADKKNMRAIALLGFCDLKLNNITSAENNFKKLAEIKQNSPLALEGLGDIEFINYRYKNALKFYTKSYRKNKNNSALINKIILSSIFAQEPEITIKTAKIYSKKGYTQFYDFYNVGTTTAKYIQKDKINLSDEYVKKAITSNPFWNIPWLEFGKRELENDNMLLVQNILEAVYLSEETDYKYYYLDALFKLKNQNINEAVKSLDKTIELSPDFESAKRLKSILSSPM